MGRTLDTLRQGDAHRAAPAPGAAASDSTTSEHCVVDWTVQEEVPFVEVGDPGKGVELSPLLVKHPAQVKVQPPHPPLAHGLASAKSMPVVHFTEAVPMTAALQTWPGPAAPGCVAPEVITHHRPDHAVSKEYAALLERILQIHTGRGPHVLLLCGHKPRVGTSTVLLNLAVCAARVRPPVAVLEMNLPRPCLAARLGHIVTAGVREVVAGTIANEQAITATAIPGLHLCPAGGANHKGGLANAEAVTWLIAWLRERYELILIDGPSTDDLTDLALLAPNADGMYLVLPQSEGETPIRGVAQQVTRLGGRLRGLIHTCFEPQHAAG
jgi:Mrp family chromosome partitioning ATPase